MISQKTSEMRTRAEDLVSASLELDDALRDAFLIEACAGEERLCREVTWLREVLRQPNHTARDLLRKRDGRRESLGARLPDNYRLIRYLGESEQAGISLVRYFESDTFEKLAVFIANQGPPSELPQRTPHDLMHGALAQLQHPAFARLLDRGNLPDGHAYLAIEPLEGLALGEFLHLHRPDCRTRLVVFLRVCDAVQYAHGQLRIHGDIRPANILVDGRGQVTLLFLGIAPLLGSAHQRGMRQPLAGSVQRGGYASPEQYLGKPLSTATDIYSLGVLLYEILTGSGPWARTIQTGEVVWRYSLAQQPRQVHATRGATTALAAFWQTLRAGTRELALLRRLEKVVARAMQLSPNERYESVSALRADIEALLQTPALPEALQRMPMPAEYPLPGSY